MAILPEGADIRWISDLTGAGAITFFTRGSDPHPLCESAGAGTSAGFIFRPWVIHGYPKFQILMILT
jgi:hypothetical protein